MATACTKPVRRKVGVPVERGRDLVVSIYPNGTLGLRPSGLRREHTVTIARVYRLACELTAIADAKAKHERRNERRALKGLAPVPQLVKRGKL